MLINKTNHPQLVDFSSINCSDSESSVSLETMEIEFSLRCNFKCPYCYIPSHDHYDHELSLMEQKEIILQAKALGVKEIIILGGEPSIYPSILEAIRFCRSIGLSIEIFTNGTGITEAFVQQLFDYEVSVVLKMNSFDKALQDKLSGKKGAFEIIQNAFNLLKKGGYPDQTHFFAVSSIICKQNIDELPELWRWLRSQEIMPYFEIITPQSNAKINEWLYVSPKRLGQLFDIISQIDKEEFGREWSVQPPLVGNTCLRHKYSCLVTSTGEVMPCVGITLSQGNLKDKPLKDILKNSDVFNDLKNHNETIKGPCRSCEKSDQCYGCRGTAFQMTGDYLASDPMCWHHNKIKS